VSARGGALTSGAPLLPLLVLASLQFMDQANQSAFAVLLPDVQKSFRLSDAGILTIVALASAGALLCTVPVAMLADRFNRVRIAIVGAVVWSCFSIGLGLAASAVMAAVMFSLTTMGQSVVFPTHNSLLSDYYPVGARQKVYAVHRAGVSLGAVFGVLAGAGLATLASHFVSQGWRVPFFVFPAFTIAAAAVALRLREPKRGTFEQDSLGGGVVVLPAASAIMAPVKAPPPSFGEAWRLVWKIQTLRRIFMALPFLAAALVGFGSIASLQYQHTFGLDPAQRAYLAAPVQIFDLLGLYIGARFGTKLAQRDLRLVFPMLAVASFVAAGLASLFAFAPSVPVAFIANAGIDMAFAVVGPGVLAALSLAIPARARALGFSIGALFILPGLVIIPIVGAIGDHVGLRYGLLALIPVFAIGGLILGTAGRVIDSDVKNVWTSMHARQEMMAARLEGRLPLLAVRDLRASYGTVRIIDGLDFEIAEREIVALLGTNGAGKSTLLRSIGGVVEADGGAVIFDGRDVTHMLPQEIACLGVSQMPGGAGVFPSLSVEENLHSACWQERKKDGATSGHIAEVFERFPSLAERRHSLAGDLSGGQQQMLAIGMALLGQPKLLLVDELSLGLAPIVVEQLLGVLRLLRDGGTAIVLVEQSVNVALAIADRAYVMDKGAVVFSGLAEELAARPEVLRSVYLHSKTSGHTRRARAIADAPVALEVVDISIAFGGLVALDRVSIAVPEGHVLGIIGPNGAGKTTLFDIVSGYVRPATGKVILNGRDVTPWSASARARAGLGRSFQDSRLFDDLTVRGALAVALERWIDVGDPMSAMLRTPALALTEAAVERRVDELVELFGLEAHQERLVSELSTGLRRLVDLASITAQSPRVILLDEPSSGIAQREVEELAAVLDRLRARLAATLIVVEHDIAFVRSFADQLVALDQGSVLAAGDPDAVLSNDDVIAAFLGLDPVTRQRSGHADALGAAPSSARRAGDRPSHDGGNRGEDRSTLP